MTKTQVEVITSVQRRRSWSRAEKERIVAAAMEPGAVACVGSPSLDLRNLAGPFSRVKAAEGVALTRPKLMSDPKKATIPNRERALREAKTQCLIARHHRDEFECQRSSFAWARSYFLNKTGAGESCPNE